ncbi:MAG TPA: YbaK/EbsC family protein [Candidatus Saccharimonadales bacterium]|jgi:prolyl-tRNA editing enzyme YbaK/EbsC (Cys-tRNA(Pro) deacylase)|nr:YbaK/EbsC family protein [Candidatus Saccharimonadales bacterium]
MTTLLLPQVHRALGQAGIVHRELACDPALADTAVFCEHYNFALAQSANAILVAGKGDPKPFACCIVLATRRLDVNKAVCKQMGVKKASFASAEQTRAMTGMEIGGVTPFGLPASVPIYIDAAVMEQPEVVMGGGNRSSKVVLNPAELHKIPNVIIVENLAKPTPE